MQQFSEHELDAKIHGFLARKTNEFSALDVERQYTAPTRWGIHAKLRRVYAAPFIQLES